MKLKELLNTDKKVRIKTWTEDSYVQYSAIEELWIDESGEKYDCKIFSDTTSDEWEYYIEPKKKKQITFYEYVVYSLSFKRYNQTLVWSDLTPDICSDKHTGNTKTVEIDEE